MKSLNIFNESYNTELHFQFLYAYGDGNIICCMHIKLFGINIPIFI